MSSHTSSASPYSTGARLEPHPWLRDGITGSEYQRPAEVSDLLDATRDYLELVEAYAGIRTK